MKAAESNHFKVLRWAFENGCPLGEENEDSEEEVCQFAARHGNIEMMKWAIDFGVEFSDTVLS